jgi:hypothetical protein
MNQEIFFTLAEYKQNYERLKNEFIDAYVDNDDEEFISSQVEWYQRCLDNTILEFGIIADSIGWETKAIKSLEGIVGVVNKKIRNERGGIIKETAQNLNVSFKKILKYLEKEKQNTSKVEGSPTQVQWALYHYILQECKLKPRFQHKVKEISNLAEEYGIGYKNLQLKYNQISNSGGQEGYTEDDVLAVKLILERNYPKAIPKLNILTQHIF